MKTQTHLPDEQIISKIYLIRGKKVMLDYDLAELYGTETKYLKRQVRRNAERFPEDFMIELSKEEYDALRCQVGTLKQGAKSALLTPPFITITLTKQITVQTN